MHAFGKAARIGYFKTVVLPLHMDRAQLRVIPMDQGIGHRFSKAAGRIVGNADALHAHEDFLFRVESPETSQHFVHDAQ